MNNNILKCKNSMEWKLSRDRGRERERESELKKIISIEGSMHEISAKCRMDWKSWTVAEYLGKKNWLYTWFVSR